MPKIFSYIHALSWSISVCLWQHWSGKWKVVCHWQHLSLQEACLFQLIGVVSALTPEECIKENKELRKFTEFRERKKINPTGLANALSGWSSVWCVGKNDHWFSRVSRLCTELAMQRWLQTVINRTGRWDQY